MWLSGARMNPADPADLLATIEAEDVFDALPDLPHITAPTLVVAGERDRFYGADLFGRTADAIPDARLRMYPGKGHVGVLVHRPAMGEILGFLAGDHPNRSGHR